MFSKELSLSQIIDQGRVNELSLTIYYFSPYMLTLYAYGVKDIIRRQDDKVVVNGNQLEEYIDLIKVLSNADLMPVEHKTYLNARLYYVFETKEQRKVLEVCMWGADDSIFVNDIEVEENDIFYNIIWPFLPDEAVKEFKNYLNYGLGGLQYCE